VTGIKGNIKEFLDQKVEQYNRPSFIELDPISIPHRFERKEDIEIAGFLTAIISWGNRVSILKNARCMMNLMDNSPYEFIIHHEQADLLGIRDFVHRTFNGEDLIAFIKVLKRLYRKNEGLEGFFTGCTYQDSLQVAIHQLKIYFIESGIRQRSLKHISDPLNGSAAKRINMFLRWMIRNDNMGVDFGLWKSISPSVLSCPLDIHSGNMARKLGLLNRKQNDAKAVRELDTTLRGFDPLDPARYDFALFGLGVYEKF